MNFAKAIRQLRPYVHPYVLTQRTPVVIPTVASRGMADVEVDPNFYDPPGLFKEPDIPEYEELYIKMKGYDFPVLETYAKYVHNLVRDLFKVTSDNWAVPPRKSNIKKFIPNTAKVEAEFDLSLYERVVQMEDVPSTKLQLIVEVLTQNLPEGVQLSVIEPSSDEDEFRFIPDQQLQLLQGELRKVEEEKEARRKK